MKTYNGFITSFSSPEYVFVFGSNTLGAHGGGAARVAVDHFGAVMGRHQGMHGQSYAIPTCTGDIRLLPLDEIQDSVDVFLTVVRANPKKTFFLTPIGTGTAGGRVEDMAYLFRRARDLPNLVFPAEFLDHLFSPWEPREAISPNEPRAKEGRKK